MIKTFIKCSQDKKRYINYVFHACSLKLITLKIHTLNLSCNDDIKQWSITIEPKILVLKIEHKTLIIVL